MESVFFQSGTVVAHHADPAGRLILIVSGYVGVVAAGGWVGGWKGGRERAKGREEGSVGGREGGRERAKMEGGRERWREGRRKSGREGETSDSSILCILAS